MLIECSECHGQVSDKAKKCPHCGSPVERKRVCPECGASSPVGVETCPNCGYDLCKVKHVFYHYLPAILSALAIILIVFFFCDGYEHSECLALSCVFAFQLSFVGFYITFKRWSLWAVIPAVIIYLLFVCGGFVSIMQKELLIGIPLVILSFANCGLILWRSTIRLPKRMTAASNWIKIWKSTLKIIGFLAAEIVFGFYFTYASVIPRAFSEASNGAGLIVAAILYPLIIFVPQILLWRVFWGIGARSVVSFIAGCLTLPHVYRMVNVAKNQELFRSGFLISNVPPEFWAYAIASTTIGLAWCIIIIECFKARGLEKWQRVLRYVIEGLYVFGWIAVTFPLVKNYFQ